jgi:urease accessory protein
MNLMPSDEVALLRLLQLADSAIPVGAVAHSFGLESMMEEGLLTVDGLEAFLRDYLVENGALEAYFCRAAYRLSPFATSDWLDLNERLSARRLSRESREASLAMGRRFLRLVAALLPGQTLPIEIESHRIESHHVTAFGLVASVVGIGERSAVVAWLHQSTAALVSAMQRLAPLGQTRASQILWALKPQMAKLAEVAMEGECECFTPLPELAGMRHPRLPTRLFIS